MSVLAGVSGYGGYRTIPFAYRAAKVAVTVARLTLPASGWKVGQMINRAGEEFSGKPQAFLDHAKDLIQSAGEAGTYVEATFGTIYRVGNTYRVVKDYVLTSFITNADPSRGIVTTYTAVGGK